MLLHAAALDVPTPDRPRFLPAAEIEVDERRGTITRVTPLPAPAGPPATLVIPGLIDAHAHLPQYPLVGRHEPGLLPWLEKHVFPAERRFTGAARPPAELAAETDAFFAALAAHGITTAVLFAAIWEDSTRLAFETAARRGQRAIIGKVMMDEGSYGAAQPVRARQLSLAESRRLAADWHGANQGLLEYAVSPRFAVRRGWPARCGSCPISTTDPHRHHPGARAQGKLRRDRRGCATDFYAAMCSTSSLARGCRAPWTSCAPCSTRRSTSSCTVRSRREPDRLQPERGQMPALAPPLRTETPMKVLLIYPEFPDTFWSFKHALNFVRKSASTPPWAPDRGGHAFPRPGNCGSWT